MTRFDQVFLACCLSGFGLSVAAIIALRNPLSRLSRWIDGRALPEAVTS